MIKQNDFLCYALVYVESHGFMVKPGEKHTFKADVWKEEIELLHSCRRPGRDNLTIKSTDVERLIPDPREEGTTRTFIIVYKYGKTPEQVAALIQPQLKELLYKLKVIYEKFAQNVQEMADFLGTPSPESNEYICEGK